MASADGTRDRSRPDDFQPGYPIDLRPAHVIKRRAADPIGDFEAHAARIVARFSGERVLLQDDNSHPSMPDICLDYLDRPPAFVEVVVDVDGRSAALYDAIARIGWTIAAPMLTRHWWVTLNPKADLRKLRAELPTQLSALEANNVALGVLLTPWQDHDALAQEWITQGVSGLISADVDQGAGSIRVRPIGTHGPTSLDWQGFDHWVSDYLTSDPRRDVRHKLASTGASERHAFVGTTFSTPWAATNPLRDHVEELPPSPPRLPPEVTHLWLAGANGPGRTLCWFPDRGWFDPGSHWATP